MNVYFTNRQFRALANSSFLNAMGSVLFNLVFLVYAQTLPFKTLAVSLVSIANLMPSIFMIVNGYLADNTQPRHRFRLVFELRGIQGLLYFCLAFIIREPATLKVFVILLLINVVSDLIADYTSDLIMHYQKLLLAGKDEYQTALGFSAGVHNIISMVFQAVGASLIVLLHNNFPLFAVINGFSFLLAGFVLIHDRQLFIKLDNDQETVQSKKLEKRESLRVGMGHAIKIVYQDKQIFVMVMLAAGVNTLGLALDGLTSVLLASNHTLWIGGFASTVASISIIGSLAITLSALFMHDGLQHVSLPALTAVTMISLVLFSINMCWWQSPIIMLTTMALASYPIGKINPRLQGDIFSKVDSKHLTATVSVISTVTMLGGPLGNFIFLGVANMINPEIAWVVFGIVSLLVGIIAIICAVTLPNQSESVN
ncbi:major facilitator superfamily protein [Lacticaseibacillus paracasei subsp. paracasei Lpp70]|uniref:Major facilitator superfamily protein n=1 Tax=Lacticaseibacillus paracasei subsp. paracasei Lpp7 TaxID=1256200 RepID=A0A8E0M7N6_LACPA|nr:major facilitator superfamily protein [Lacticaseibacillus paracasei subsp. paracasei Lpp7]EPD07427.1 major facilitator superfamily protein [Lacticaseibacillus paracasei subsp. paracasei Lpp70]